MQLRFNRRVEQLLLFLRSLYGQIGLDSAKSQRTTRRDEWSRKASALGSLISGLAVFFRHSQLIDSSSMESVAWCGIWSLDESLQFKSRKLHFVRLIDPSVHLPHYDRKEREFKGMFCFFSTTRFGNVHSNFIEFHILMIFRDHSAKKCCQKAVNKEHTLTGIIKPGLWDTWRSTARRVYLRI